MSSKSIYDSNFFIDKFVEKLSEPHDRDMLLQYTNIQRKLKREQRKQNETK
ncbi:hypothetical protein UFOVP84_58 [uncultured Caudovirales phage]|uniref:Uncharacterized protein n=1 Tax=uncultured Caudovirales phage TaxID=2100421 RepID=A0A6J5L3M6_9CAUD|nr:hypothetical protein UFOVP84_58 [uncultured Caudovirales phage]